ncbi:MAG: DNA repair protein RecO [Xanthomonadales bacterium]|nr:DNA repair protein RecO [Xanthomonadales bacterium]
MHTDIAFVLHKRAYKESSELIKLLTKNHGIVDVIAKGSRKPKSKLNGQLQPFSPIEIVYSGRSELKTLTSAFQQGAVKACAYKNHVSMLYCSELLTLLHLDNEACHELFTAYQTAVMALQNTHAVSLILRKFEWQLTQNLGYELSIPPGVEKNDFLSFDPGHGLLLNNDNKICPVSSLKKFTSNQPMQASDIKQVNELMKSVVNHLVHGKTIQSRALLMN